MKKKILSLFIPFLVICFIMSGCSGNDSGSESGAGGSDGGNNEKSKEPVTLTMYSWRTEDQAGYEKIIKAFEADHPDIHVEFKPFKSTEYNTILSNTLVSGQGADIIQLRPYNKDIPDNGYLVPLDDIKGLSNISDQFKDAARGSDGKVYGVPLSLNNAVIFYNTKIFEENGISVPKTWEDFVNVCETLKSKGITPIAQSGNAAYLLSLLHSVIAPSAYGGNEFVEKITSGETDFTDEGFKASVQRMKDLAQYFPKDFVGISDDDAQGLLYAGKAAMYINGDYRLSEFHEKAPDLPVDVIPALETQNGKAPVTAWVDSSYAVVKKSEHVEEAKVFMEFLASKQFGQMFSDTFARVSAVSGVSPEQPIIKKISQASDKATTPYLMLVHFTGGSPSTKTTFENALQGMYTGQVTIDQVIQETQQSAEKWFKPMQ
ncbi:MAG TPA: extracellular solute-binding protein [Bacillales bacterium]|nr:extracellular solute-binding protein [Bacillales bacterium]